MQWKGAYPIIRRPELSRTFTAFKQKTIKQETKTEQILHFNPSVKNQGFLVDVNTEEIVICMIEAWASSFRFSSKSGDTFLLSLLFEKILKSRKNYRSLEDWKLINLPYC